METKTSKQVLVEACNLMRIKRTSFKEYRIVKHHRNSHVVLNVLRVAVIIVLVAKATEKQVHCNEKPCFCTLE